MQPFKFLRRGRVWTIVYEDSAGKKRQQATPCRGPEEEEKAEGVLREFALDRQRDARLANAGGQEGPLTVARWAEQWMVGLAARDVDVDFYRSKFRLHILPIIGHMRLDAVVEESVDSVLASVKAKGRAPRTRLHVYWAMHSMFEEAVPRLLAANPCRLKKRQLPKKTDKDPEWRGGAKFTRAEAVMLMTDERIPPDRRVFYAILFLAGPRFGEASALKWRHYQPEFEPLGQLLVAYSYNSRSKKPRADRIKRTKTEKTRKVPVHPWLASILHAWRAGWAEMMGRPPTADDPIVPTNKGTHRNCSTGWRQMNGEPGTKKRDGSGERHAGNPGDLARLGIQRQGRAADGRPLRHGQHDTRRTFIGLALDDGAHKDLLRLVTHGPEGDIMDLYRGEAAWESLCKEVAKLRLGPGCQEVAMPKFMNVIDGLESDPSGIRKRGGDKDNDGKTVAVTAKRRGSAVARPSAQGTSTANTGQSRPMATLATLALRQALAALDRGRIDQAREVLRRAIEEEAQDTEAVS